MTPTDRVLGLVGVLMFLGAMACICAIPGILARKRKHPQTQAINLLGWCGLIFPPCIIAAVVWAMTKAT